MPQKPTVRCALQEELGGHQLLIEKHRQKQQEQHQQRRLLHQVAASRRRVLRQHFQMTSLIHLFILDSIACHPPILTSPNSYPNKTRHLNTEELSFISWDSNEMAIVAKFEGCFLFNFYYNNRIQAYQRMKGKRVEAQKWAYKFTKPTVMKFQPVEDFDQPPETASTSFINRLKNFFSPPSKTKIRSPIKRLNSLNPDARQQLLKKNIAKKPLLKYVKRLTNEHVLIGNEDQLDAMCISGIIHEFVDTEFLWSINIKRAILHMAVDLKKNYIILLPEKEVIVYSFDPKLIYQKPKVVSSITLSNEVRFVQVVKDSTFILCYATGIQVYSIDELKGIRLFLQKKYELPAANSLNLLQIPQPYQNILNVFFSETVETSSSLGLWNIEIEFSEKQVKMSKPFKIYDIPHFLKSSLKLENYSKDIYFINLGREIYAVRKGYIIDSANVNISSENSYLKYISHQKLMHVSEFKVEIYRFKVDIAVNPPRITLESTDSIQIPKLPEGFAYVDAVEVLGQNFAVFYQTKQEENKMMHGELKYGFIISHLVKLEDKINSILPQEIGNVDIDTINEKADMVKKMGLERKDIYLRLWNNSQKTEIEDYKILLDTLDYDTIKTEIEKKLKKASMNLRQMILLEQGCLAMLHENVFGLKSTKEDIKNYFISHMLLRKLELYRLISTIDKKEGRAVTEDEEGKLLINIQNYNYYKTVDVKSLFYELIIRHCTDDKRNEAMKIRTVLRHFKFSLRINYQELLEEIIIKTRKGFLKILEAIPELLPFEHTFQNDQQEDVKAYFEGIWKEITPEQWEKHLYIDTVLTIDNKEVLSEVCSNVWFKRYWLTQQEYVNYNKKQIQEIHERNCSDITFYNVIQKIFDHIKDFPSVRALIDFLQDRYERLPQHLFGKIFLYRKLFEQFKQNQKNNKIEESISNFSDFLKLRDDDIFKVMFNIEKVKKNFILKEMKILYQGLSSNQVFNEGLLSYFASDKSEISDIKYLLNRMNNEKREFHIQNEGIYEVLVRGMTLKLKIGSPEDIPIDEVLIYIENIPLSPQNPSMKDLQTMRLINEESQRFKKIKLNMSIFDMMKNVDNVIASLVNYQIKDAKLLELRSFSAIKDIAYRIISDVQQLKQKIFSDTEYSELTLFTFLTNMLEEKELIPMAGLLLEDDWINSNFSLNQIMIENLVLYMYKWKMNENPSYSESNPFLKELVNLLPIGNRCREYIEAEIEFSEMLSTPEQSIFYPLSNGNDYFTTIELESIIGNTSPAHLLTVNIEKLHECALKIQQISTDGKYSDIKLHNIYEIIILRLVECDMLKEVIDKIKTLIEIQGNTPYNFIYPSILVSKIAPELIEENKNLLLKCASYLFYEPKILIQILGKLMSIKATSQEYKHILKKYYEQVKTNHLTYSDSSPVLEKIYLSTLDSEEIKQKYMHVLRHTLNTIISYKQQFSTTPEYFIIYTILCNDPYVLAQYLYCNKYTINIKDFRCFLSFLIKEDIFNKQNLLEFGKRMFYIIYEKVSKNKNIELTIEQTKKVPLQISKEIDRIKEAKSQFEKKISKSLDRLKFKIKTVNTEVERKRQKGTLMTDEERKLKFRQRLLSSKPRQISLQYPFLDSDDNPKAIQPLLKKQERKNANALDIFDKKYERHSLIKRTQRQIGLYISIERQKQQRSMYYTQKFVKDGIFASIGIDKGIQNVIQNAINEAFRDSRKMSGGKKLRIGKVTSQYIDLNSLNLAQRLSNRRSKAVSQISEEEMQEIQKKEESLVQQQNAPEVGNIMAEATLLNQIIKQNMEIKQNTIFDFTPLDQYKGHQNFSSFLLEIAKLAYAKDIPFKGVLIFIRQLSEKYPELQIKKEWLDIYVRAEALEAKHRLDIPLRDILKIDGLFIESQLSQKLFNYLLPYIVSCSNDQNILKMCKLIALAFKKAALKQDILFSYLVELFVKFERSFTQAGTQEKELKMEREKIYLILNQIPIKVILTRQDELTRQLGDEDARKEIIGLVVTSFRRRYDQKAADQMEQKWIKKQPLLNSQM